MKTKKYLLMPGIIKSVNDGDHHFITRLQLLGLYGVHERECIIYEPGKIHPNVYAKLIKLYPREDGKYVKIKRRKRI